MGLTFGFNTYGQSAEAAIALAADSGLGHVEIDLVRRESAIGTWTNQRAEEARKRAETAGVGLSLHTSYRINPADQLGILRRAAVGYLKQCVALAARLGSTHLTVHLGHFPRSPHWPWARTQALQRLVVSLETVLKVCRHNDVPLALENVVANQTDSATCKLGDRPGDFEAIYAALDSEYLALCLDVGHAHAGEGIGAYVEPFGDRIACVHCHDNSGRGDEHLAIGDGTVLWSEVAAALGAAGFSGPVISECLGSMPQRDARRLREIFADINSKRSGQDTLGSG